MKRFLLTLVILFFTTLIAPSFSYAQQDLCSYSCNLIPEVGGITLTAPGGSQIIVQRGQCEALKNDYCVDGGTCTDPINRPEDCKVKQPANLPTNLRDFGGVISTIVGAAILIAAIAAFLYLIWGGIQWITSGGDKSALETARGRITAAIVGLVIVGAAWGVFKIIENVFGFTSILQGV